MTQEMHGFEVPQFYETAIVMRHREKPDREFRFLCVPTAAIHADKRHMLDDPPALLSELGLAESTPLQVAQLPDAIFTLLMLDDIEEEALPDTGSVLAVMLSPDPDARLRGEDPDAALFAEYLAFAEVVPLEQSKVTGYALATLAMTSYSAAKGITDAAPHAALVFGPHAPVVYAAALGLAGTVVVVDSIGVIVGVVTSPRTQEVLRKVRDGIGGLIHRMHPAHKDAIDQAVSQAPPSEVPVQKKGLTHGEIAKKQAILKERAKLKPKFRPAGQ